MKKYEKYKSVDLIWLNEVPEHWELLPIISVLSERKEKNYKNNSMRILSVLKDVGVMPYEQKGNIGNKFSEDISKYNLVLKDDIVINSMNIIIGSVGKSKYNGILSQVYYVLKNRNIKKTNIDYLEKVFKHKIFQEHFKIYGRGILEHRLKIPMEKLKRVRIPIPPFEEQKQIANYLDWKINEIDKLIEKINLQIIQLNEFKKINIDKKFKNLSGMEYKLKNIFIFGKGLSITKEDLNEEGKFKCINYGEIHRELGFSFNCNTTKLKFLKNDNLINAFALLNKDDFIFCDTSEDYEGCGNFTYLEDSDINNKIYAGYHTVVAKPKIKVNSRYLAYYFMSTVWRNEVIKRVNGVKVYSITQNILKNITVIIPDNYIQLKIIEELDLLVNKINLLIDKHSKIIKKYEELKSSLISEVVTGKIDVRDVIIPKYEKLNVNEVIKEDSFKEGIENGDE